MRGNDQKFGVDSSSRSPALNQYSNMMGDFHNTGTGYTGSERMPYSTNDFGRMNSAGGMPFSSSSGFNANLYERDFKQPTTYNAPTPQQYPTSDFKSNFDPNSVFVPQSKYLQEEMKKNNFNKEFSYNSQGSSNNVPMKNNFQNTSIPQPQSYDMKPEVPK